MSKLNKILIVLKVKKAGLETTAEFDQYAKGALDTLNFIIKMIEGE